MSLDIDGRCVDTDSNNTNAINNNDKTNSSATGERTGRGLLAKHFPGLFQASGSLAASNSVSLFGKYLSSAFALSYGTRGAKDKVDALTHDHVDEDKGTHVTFVKAVTQSKHPVEVLLISNHGNGDNTDISDEDNSLSSYLDDKAHVDKEKRPQKLDNKDEPTGKNIITLKEKNANLIKLIANLKQDYALQVKQIVPFDDIPSELKTSVIKDLIKVNEMNGQFCYVIVVNGDEAVISQVLALRGVSVTRVGRDMSKSLDLDQYLPRDVAKALSIYEKQQIEELRKKLNKTETPSEDKFDKNRECSSFTLYVF
ncbi:uncharacterized protein LOC103519038 [Diaphorina citri]|uniref:Uncharacterized protein LOC103519038 n=1 Tax=Diaphorina citri TaxID=121845 RepID=A0A3Q0JH89_DIACI|nr:uncharacterized protein LOC103519038 [Diaphorina citri]